MRGGHTYEAGVVPRQYGGECITVSDAERLACKHQFGELEYLQGRRTMECVQTNK